ncbi:hypothetical protein ACIHFC_11400 [Streptomyces sp. NPDC052013]|uniref:hypothetical protein n=1 Tax=Streptomyces sp. NPDC052013 TaxID=3365679 RepID=UPI0037CCF79A
MTGMRRLMTLVTAAVLVVLCGAAPGTAAPGAFNDCTAPGPGETCLFLTLTTGGDDLRGGGNNLTVTVHTRSQGSRAVGNVNQDAGWANGSTHTIGISLLNLFGQNITATEITTVSLTANLLRRSPFEDTDNWNLDSAKAEHSVSGTRRTLDPAVQTTPFRFTVTNNSRDLRIDGLLDGGFEWQGFRAIGAPWTTEGPDPKGADVGLGLHHSGRNNAWIRTSSRNWNAVLQTIPVTPRRNYVLRGWVRTSGHGSGATVNTVFFGVRMSGLWPPVEQQFGPSPAGRYQEIVQPFNPGDRTSVTVFCGFWGLGSDGWILFDDLSVLPA